MDNYKNCYNCNHKFEYDITDKFSSDFETYGRHLGLCSLTCIYDMKYRDPKGLKDLYIEAFVQYQKKKREYKKKYNK